MLGFANGSHASDGKLDGSSRIPVSIRRSIGSEPQATDAATYGYVPNSGQALSANVSASTVDRGSRKHLDGSEGMVRDYAAMMTAKNEGMDTIAERRVRANTPTPFHQWCERELVPVMGA